LYAELRQSVNFVQNDEYLHPLIAESAKFMKNKLN
jgi:histidine ammonia-lyase